MQAGVVLVADCFMASSNPDSTPAARHLGSRLQVQVYADGGVVHLAPAAPEPDGLLAIRKETQTL